MIRLTLTGVDLLPPGNIFALEGKSSASTKAETDIYGNQVVVASEIKNSNQLWTVGAAFVDLTTTQNSIAAFENHSALVLTDELGATTNAIITEYPGIERHKMPDGSVLYTVKLTIGKAPPAWGIPVVSLSGPRQFGR